MKTGYRILLSLNAGAPASLVEQALEALWPGMAEELVGLFIEDSEIFEMARLPVAREIRRDGGRPRPPDAASMEREFRQQAARLREIFERRARHLARRCAFRVARSSPAMLLREASEEFDVLLLADSPERPEYHWAIRRQLALLIQAGPRMIVIARPAQPFARRIAVLCDGSEAGQAALRTAQELAAGRDLELLLLLPPGGEAPPSGPGEENWRVRRLPGLEATSISGLLRAEGVAFLVLPRRIAAAQPAVIAELVDRAPCSVILSG